jgi:Domain of unknown function (DUF4185)
VDIGELRAVRLRLIAAAVLALVLVAIVVWNAGPSGHPLVVDAVTDSGTLHQPADWLRDGAQSALVGNRILWIFGDTIFPATTEDGSHLRTNSAARSDPVRPFELHDRAAGGVPTQFVPFDELEAAYNTATGRPDDRVAVWPNTVLSRPDGSAVVFFEEVRVLPGPLNFSIMGSGVATVGPGSGTAVRDSNLLFHAPDPTFSAGAVAADGFVYLYGCDHIEGFRFGCRVARAPEAGIHDRSAYEFWDGSAWTGDAGAAAFDIEGPNSGLSVSWNPWLGRYLAVYSPALSNRVMMRTAPSPEGPWSAPTLAFEGAPPAESMLDYSAFEHPELARDGGRTIFISYFHALGPLRGEFRVVRVRLG